MLAGAIPTRQVGLSLMRGVDRALYLAVELERDGLRHAEAPDEARSRAHRLADGSIVDVLNEDELVVRFTKVRLRKAD